MPLGDVAGLLPGALLLGALVSGCRVARGGASRSREHRPARLRRQRRLAALGGTRRCLCRATGFGVDHRVADAGRVPLGQPTENGALFSAQGPRPSPRLTWGVVHRHGVREAAGWGAEDGAWPALAGSLDGRPVGSGSRFVRS